METKKILISVMFLALFAGNASAAITGLDIVNLFPTEDTRETGTSAVVRVEADATTTTTVELWLTKPNGTVTHVGSHTLTVKAGNPRENAFTIPSNIIDQYGKYTFKTNETNDGLNQSINNTISPNPDISIAIPNTVYPNEEVEDAQIVVRAQSGNAIPTDEIIPGNITLYKINDDPDTANVEKTIVRTIELFYDSSTNNLEASIPVKNLSGGDYEVIGKFNISSCDTCQNFPSTISDTFLVRTGYDRLNYQEKWGNESATTLKNGLKGEVVDESKEVERRISSAENNVLNIVAGSTGVDRVEITILILLVFNMVGIAYISSKAR